jgi:hypothetical protein
VSLHVLYFYAYQCVYLNSCGPVLFHFKNENHL